MNLQHAGKQFDSLDASEVEVSALQQAYAPVNPAISVPLLDRHTSKRLTFRPDPLVPTGERADEPSLRSTWEHPNPKYCDAGAGAPGVVVIAGDDAQPLPDGIAQRRIDYRLSRQFIGSENVFGYKSIVKAYLPAHYPQRR